MDGTRREQIISLLKEHSCSLESLCRQFGVPFKVMADDLSHIERSIKSEYRLKQYAPECQSCGFQFIHRDKWQKPSRCPKCKSERISEGLVEIIAK